jgi:FkbM family methyltransferase
LNTLKKLFLHFRRIFKGRRFGVRFVRRASFTLPTTVRLCGKSVPVFSPAEEGARNDFLTCFIEDEYGLGEIRFPVQTIADIGANIGFFSMAARSYFPTATVHAYEPNPRVLPYASKNAISAQFTLFAEAVGAKAGFVSIEDSGDSNQARTISPESESRIKQVPLSSVVQRLGGRIDLAKIDCEGAEWELFTDSAAWPHIRHIRMEYHLWGKRAYSDVEQCLSSIGFRIHFHKPSGDWGTIWARNLKPNQLFERTAGRRDDQP